MQDCNENLTQVEVNTIISSSELKQLQDKINFEIIKNEEMINCTKCNQTFLFKIGELEKNIKDERGKILSFNHLNHRSQSRA